MYITLSPFAPLPGHYVRLTASRTGDVLTVNDQPFDFTQLPEGATLPVEAIDSEHFSGPVERINGELHLTLRLPHGPNPSQAVAFPEPIHVTEDGDIPLPLDPEPEPEVFEDLPVEDGELTA